MVLGLIAAVVLAHGSLIKAVAMIVLGLLVGLIGTDVNSGVARYSFGLPELIDGVGIGPIAMGVFGFGEIIRNLEHGQKREVFVKRVTGLMPTWKDIKHLASGPSIRGTMLGSFLGILPGGGPILGSFSAYTLEKKLAKDPSRFGKGAIEGVAAPESANNAAAQTSFIPLLTLGIPSNPVMALMIGAMIIHGIQPGPQIMTAKPELFWGMIASMWVGNLLLVVLNLPLIGMWVKLLTLEYRFLYPAILLFCCIGVYSINNTWMDVHPRRRLRLHRLPLRQARLRGGAAAAGLRAGADDGGEPAAGAAALAGRSGGVRHAPDQRHAPRARRCCSS